MPLKTPGSGFTQLGEEKNVEVYLLDMAKMTEEQKLRLVDWIVKKFSVGAVQVSAELERNGFPIRAADVAVFFDMRAFL